MVIAGVTIALSNARCTEKRLVDSRYSSAQEDWRMVIVAKRRLEGWHACLVRAESLGLHYAGQSQSPQPMSS